MGPDSRVFCPDFKLSAPTLGSWALTLGVIEPDSEVLDPDSGVMGLPSRALGPNLSGIFGRFVALRGGPWTGGWVMRPPRMVMGWEESERLGI